MFDLHTLQTYWWFLVSLIGGLFVFMMFVQGGQSLLYLLGRDEDERDLIVNVLGRKWELGFTSLVMFGGAIFAAFPLLYAVSFGGAYYIWMAILFCFIIQAVSYEYRKKPNNLFGEKFYERLLFINGTVGIFLIGVALGMFYTGGNFSVDSYNLSRWSSNTFGLEALLVPFNLLFGVVLVLLSRLLAMLYFYNSIDNRVIKERIVANLKFEFKIFLPLFLIFLIYLLFKSGYSYEPQTENIFKESAKIWHNLLSIKPLFYILILGIVLFLFGIYRILIKKRGDAIWYSGIGTILIVTTFLMLLGVNNSVLFPSIDTPLSSLTIENSSGSLYTLKVMSVVSLFVPFVLGYIFWVWRLMDSKPLTIDEVKSDPHHY